MSDKRRAKSYDFVSVVEGDISYGICNRNVVDPLLEVSVLCNFPFESRVDDEGMRLHAKLILNKGNSRVVKRCICTLRKRVIET